MSGRLAPSGNGDNFGKDWPFVQSLARLGERRRNPRALSRHNFVDGVVFLLMGILYILCSRNTITGYLRCC